jgi:acylphosphatase
MKNKITIYGKGKGKKRVHDVGYRLFLLEQADSLFIEGFDPRNITVDGLETLVVLIEGESSRLIEFIDFVKNPSNRPEEAIVDDNIIIENWEGKVRRIEKFRESFNTIQLGKIVRTGLKMCDVMTKFKEETNGNFQKLDLVSIEILDIKERLKKVESRIPI